MVNLVEAQKPLLHSLVKMAGLRHQLIEIEPGTVMSFWLPKHHVTKKKKHSATNLSEEAAAAATTHPNPTNNNMNNSTTNDKKKKKKAKKPKPAVVLVHGFAAEGIITWQFQFGPLTKDYSVYIPDLLFFNRSFTTRGDRSPEFQAECLAAALGKLGVGRCDVVGFSYGGMVAFKLAEARPELVRSVVVSGSVITMTDSISKETLKGLGVSSSSELLLPETVERLKALLSIATYKKLWFPNRLHKDYLKVMFNHRKERGELLDGLVISNAEAKIPIFSQRILLLWGENDNIFHIESAKQMEEQLGEKAKLQGIEKAGHLVHIERPCVYNRHLKKFLDSVNQEDVH